MKYLLNFPIFIAGMFLLQSCTKTESDFTEARQESITINASTLNVTTGIAVSFTVLSSVNSNNVTPDSKIYVNGNLITGSSYTFTDAGNFAVYATKGTLTSNVITINATAITSNTGYKHRVLIEEYSGTWCGNCPRILYGVDLLEQQTDKAIVVSTHLFNGDPFITMEGNNLAAQQGVGGVPTGYINRTIGWTGPQYENVAQVINIIQASASAGVAIKSSISSNNLSVTVNAAYKQPLTGGAKLTVYLVEDKLYHSQANYSANLYGGLSSIPNFEYNGVIRKVISSLSGDAIGSSGNANEKTYSIPVPANISNITNARIVAFITNTSGTVVNVQEVKVGEEKMFELL
ncbi:MAG: Omp28-related outer membrane protein [Rhizobacter sp.]|nr:Omp28-related outer membrane protein [Ferruginibacter sp.]